MLFKPLLTAVALAVSSLTSASPLTARQSSICGSTSAYQLGRIEVHGPFGTSLGFLAPDVSQLLGGGYGVLTTSRTEALVGVFACDSPFLGQPVTLGAVNAQTVPGTAVNAIGLIAPAADGGNPSLGVGSANWLALGPTYVTPAGGLPDDDGLEFAGYPAWYESTVWTVGRDSVLTPHWVNPDGTTPALQLAALPGSGGIVVTGDFDAFADSYSYVGDWIPVTLEIPPSVINPLQPPE